MIVEFEEVKLNIEEAIKDHFAIKNNEGELEPKKEVWEQAEAMVTARFKRFVPCFSRRLLDFEDSAGNKICKDLLLYWADFFNFAHRHLANEMNTEGFSAIKQKYDTTVKFLEKNATFYCSLLNENNMDNPLLASVRGFVASKIEFF